MGLSLDLPFSAVPESSALHVDQHIVDGALGHQLSGDVLQGSDQAVFSEGAFEVGVRRLHAPSSAVVDKAGPAFMAQPPVTLHHGSPRR